MKIKSSLIWIWVWSCPHSHSDGNYMAGQSMDIKVQSCEMGNSEMVSLKQEILLFDVRSKIFSYKKMKRFILIIEDKHN